MTIGNVDVTTQSDEGVLAHDFDALNAPVPESKIEFFGLEDQNLEDGAIALEAGLTDELSRGDATTEEANYTDLLQLIFDSGVGVSEGWMGVDESSRVKYVEYVWATLSEAMKGKIGLLLEKTAQNLSRVMPETPIDFATDAPEAEEKLVLIQDQQVDANAFKHYPKIIIGEMATKVRSARKIVEQQRATLLNDISNR